MKKKTEQTTMEKWQCAELKTMRDNPAKNCQSLIINSFDNETLKTIRSLFTKKSLKKRGNGIHCISVENHFENIPNFPDFDVRRQTGTTITIELR